MYLQKVRKGNISLDLPADIAGCSSVVAAAAAAAAAAVAVPVPVAGGGCTSVQWQVPGCSSDCIPGTDCSRCSNSGCSCPGCTLGCSSDCNPDGEAMCSV